MEWISKCILLSEKPARLGCLMCDSHYVVVLGKAKLWVVKIKDCQGSEVGQVIGRDEIQGYYCSKESIVHNNIYDVMDLVKSNWSWNAKSKY